MVNKRASKAVLEKVPTGASTEARPSRIRSKTTNGRRMFVANGDGRGAWARRFRDLVELHVSDCGGRAVMSEAQLSLCRRASALEIQLEALEAAMSAGKDVDIESYGRTASHLRRILESLGMGRAVKDAPLTLEAYLEQRAAEAAREAAEDQGE